VLSLQTLEEWQSPMRANNSLGRAIGASQVFQQLRQPWDTHQLGQQPRSKHHLTMQLLRTWQ